MREIKFRAWDRENKSMSKGMNINKWINLYQEASYTHGKGDGFMGKKESSLSLDNRLFLQYTGLKDSKGVEIYEGDIIKWVLEELINSGEKTKSHKGQGEVRWSKEFAMFGIKGKKCGGHWGFHEEVDYEIIGNIYENKKLLKCEK